MNPAHQAAQVYRDEPSTHTFWEILDYHLAHGFVHSTPEFFVMARPVDRAWDPLEIVDPVNCGRPELTGHRNCWHIALMAGDMSQAWNLFPYPLEWISLERKNELRFHNYERFQRTFLRCVKPSV